MRFVNLTGMDVQVYLRGPGSIAVGDDGYEYREVVTIPATEPGVYALRALENHPPVTTVQFENGYIAIFKEIREKKWNLSRDLPPPEEGVLLIVSNEVRQASPDREDLASPDCDQPDRMKSYAWECMGLVIS